MTLRAAITMKKPELPEGDDGRTIADMNVEGMPWYVPGGKRSRREKKEKAHGEPPMTGRESRYYTWGALKAALLVIGVMCAGLVAFVQFCQYVWFR